jgi:hypothetical protein
MRVDALLMLVVMSTAAMSAINFTVKMSDNTPGLYYDHVGQVQLYGSEWTLVTYVNISKLEATYNTVLDFVSQTKGVCKELSSESTSICQSHLLVIQQSLSQVHRTRAIIVQVTKTKEDENFSVGSTNSRSKRGVFNFVGSASKILVRTLSDEDATYYKNRISERQSEQLSMLKLAKEQMIVVRSLQTVNFTLADVAANEIQLNDNPNVIQKHVAENGEKTSQILSQAILLSAVNQHMIIAEHLVSQLRQEYDIILSAITFAQKGILLPQIITPEIS